MDPCNWFGATIDSTKNVLADAPMIGPVLDED